MVAPAVEGDEADEARARSLVDSTYQRLRGPLPGVPGDRAGRVSGFRSNFTREAFMAAVERSVEYIRAGDVFQVVPSQRLSADLGVHPFAVYRALRSINPSPYLGYLDLGPVTLVSSSPESLVKSDGRRVATRPIAGTRPRGQGPEQDAELAEELLGDDKERAEHVMLVDLGRNDLGRVCAPGSVEVVDFMSVERYSHVMHLSSGVTGQLRDDMDAFDADRDGTAIAGDGALLVALDAARTGRMRDIVGTIQAEQDRVIRAPLPGVLVVQGAPGTGKTAVALHRTAYLLYTHRDRIASSGVLLDGDLGLANADVFLGLSPRYTLAHVISGERTLDEVLIEAPQGFHVVPAASGATDLACMGAAEHLGLVRAFSSLAAQVEVLIVDTAAGIAQGVLQFAQAAQQVLVVICDEPASLTDGYALIKVLSRNHGMDRFRVLANRVRSPGAGRDLFERFERVTTRFLDVVLEFAGEIPEDEYLQRSVREQRPVCDAYPASGAARAAASLVLTAPGLSTIVRAVEGARKIFERMNSYAIYRIVETIRIMVFVVLAMMVYRFYPITAIMIILLAFANDIPIMAIAYDNTWLDPHPVRWDMRRVLSVSTVLGLVGVIETFGILVLAKEWLHLDLAQIQTLIFLKLAVAGHLTLFVARTRKPFFTRPFPSPLLLWSAIGTKVLVTFFVAYGFGLITPISWADIGLVWGYCLAWIFIEDLAKLFVYRRLDKAAEQRQQLPALGQAA